MQLLTQSEGTAARRRIPFYLVDETDGKTPETGVTISAGDMKLSKNGAAEANHAGTWIEIASGHYYYEATADELDTLGYWMARLTKTGVRAFIAVAQVLAVNLYDTVRAGLTALPNAAAEAAGGLFTRGAGAGQINQSANGQIDAKGVALAADVITATAIQADAITAAKVAADVSQEIRSEMDANSTKLAHLDADVSTRLPTSGYTAPPSAAAIRAEMDANSADLDSIGAIVTAINADTDDIQARIPAALVSGKMSSHVVTVATDAIDAAALKADAVTEIQSGLALSTQVDALEGDVDDIQARLPAALVGGKMDSHVNDIAAGAITAAAIAADAITAAKLAADVTTEIQSGLATAAAVAAIPTSNPSAAAIASQVRTELTVELGRVDAAVSTRATPAQVETLTDEVIAALPGAAPTANQNADALLDRAGAIDGKTPREAMRYIAATTVKESSGDPDGPITFMGLDGVTPRVRSTVDNDGNRTLVELDPS